MSLKIGIIHTYYQQGGGEDSVFEMESNLLSDTCEVNKLSFNNNSGIKGFFQFAISIWNPFSIIRTKKFIRNFKPDIIHIHNLHFAAGPVVLRTIKKMGIPVVYTLHNYRVLCPSATLLYNGNIFTDSVNGGFPWKAVKKKMYRNSLGLTFWLAFITWFHKKIGTWKMVDKYIVLTDFAKNLYVHSNFGIPANQFAVKANFVNVSNAEAVKRKAYVLFIGRLSEEKGIKLLLSAFSKMNFELRIGGDGPLKEDVLEACKNHSNIIYLGPLKKDAVEIAMCECEALIFPSIWYEGMPMTLLEAFSLGTPVIAGNLGAMASIIKNGYNGLHFEPSNENDLINKMIKWKALTISQKGEFNKNAKNSYTAYYRPNTNKANLLDVYKSIIT